MKLHRLSECSDTLINFIHFTLFAGLFWRIRIHNKVLSCTNEVSPYHSCIYPSPNTGQK